MTNVWKLNNMLLNNQWITKEIKEEIKKISRETWQWRYNYPKPMGCNERSSKRMSIAIQAYLRKQEKSQINNLTLHLNNTLQLEIEQTKPKITRRK